MTAPIQLHRKRLIPISSGAKTELLILQVIRALFIASIDAEKSDQILGAVVRNRNDNKIHKINARIDRRIKKLMERIDDVFDQNVSKETYQWISKKSEQRIVPALKKVSEYDLPLELIALYMLYVNFCERTKPLIAALEPFANPYLYFDEIDILKKTNFTEDDESNAHDIAIEILKGLRP